MARNDGRYLEDAVQEELKKISCSHFHFRRLYDTYTAKKGMPPQPADFFLSSQKGHCFRAIHLECKTTKSNTLRFDTFSQLADMKRWAMAGVLGYVLVHFYTPDRLFMIDVDDLDETAASWKASVVGSEFTNMEEVIGYLRRILWI